MILYNTTFAVDANRADDFIAFAREQYMPACHRAGHYDLLLTELAGERSVNSYTSQPVRTFALQMRVPTAEALAAFRSSLLPELYMALGREFGIAVNMFESQLNVVYDHRKHHGSKS